jgi:thioesterase domain-containing protein
MGKNLDDTALLIGFAQTMGLRTEHVDIAPDELAALTTEEKLALIMNWARKEYPLPVEVELADMQRYFNVYGANIRALARYSPQHQRVRITFFKADEHASENGKDETLGWNALTDEKIEVAVIPGDHYTLFGGPHIGVLAEQLQAWLNKAEGVYA